MKFLVVCTVISLDFRVLFPLFLCKNLEFVQHCDDKLKEFCLTFMTSHDLIYLVFYEISSSFHGPL